MSSVQRFRSAPAVLTYPRFDQDAGAFVLQADGVHAVGLGGAVLEQDGHVIAYASRGLIKSEQQYSVMQKEYLAVVVCSETVMTLLVGSLLQNYNGSCTTPMVQGRRKVIIFGGTSDNYFMHMNFISLRRLASRKYIAM